MHMSNVRTKMLLYFMLLKEISNMHWNISKLYWMCVILMIIFLENFTGGFGTSKMVHTVEAAYNVALYVMSSEYEHENEGLASLCNTIRGKIEEVFDVNDFKNTGRSTSKQYVEWLRQKQTRMGRSRDDGPCVSNESRMSNYRSDRCAGDEQSRDRVSTYQNHSVTSEFRDGRVSDVKNHVVGFGSDSRRNTVSDDRYSENGGTSARRAQHMSNYFGKFEGATGNTSVDFPKPRTTQPQSDGMYHGYNQQNNSYKPSISENWRSRDGANGWTPRNTSTQTSSRRPADLSRNWRERD
uniref:GPI inositol-deacylase n=1 Tax=Lygus hesperus TaxID=30085 RepID=A0A0A9Z8M3_LYGHE